MKQYEEIVVQIVFMEEELLRCSNTYPVGDDAKEDIFG